MNWVLASMTTVMLPDGGVVSVSLTHIGGDHKNKQLNTGLLGGSSRQRHAMRVPIADARRYLRFAYNTDPEGELATVADLCKRHLSALGQRLLAVY